ncbi:MAG: transcriptional repressor [Actinomycetota bacterium]|nr:transcriptional repressor [Actinomycetota bacterium]
MTKVVEDQGGRATATATATAKDVVPAAMDLLRRTGGRATPSRRQVLQALVDARDEHRTAEQLAADIHARHPEVHPATVYRTLDRLEELGIAYHAHLGHGPAQWHLGPAGHPHLTCDRCGAVIEADRSVFEELAQRILATQGFAVDFRHFAVAGACAACRSTGPKIGRHLK